MADGKPVSAALDDVRRRIDEVDDRLHDLLMERARLVESAARAKQSDKVEPFRPGREAQILRRLVGRHRGRFPRPALVRLWRELLGGTVAMQAPLSVALSGDVRDLARDHFGSQAPLLPLVSPDEVIAAVAEGRATVGVVPVPENGGGADPWWLRLDAEREGPRIIARLPFGTVGSAIDECHDAFVLAAMAADASGDDCTLFAIRAARDLAASSLTDAFLAVQLDAAPLAATRAGAYLVEIDALVAPGEARLEEALARIGGSAGAAWLGCYARPLPDLSLSGVAPE
jgi:chorismate mutase